MCEEIKVKAQVERLDLDSNKFIVSYNDKLYQLAMLPFQRKQEKPDTIDCLLRQENKDSILLTQDLDSLIREKYKEGEEVEFKIKHAYADYFIIEDQYGFKTTLTRAGTDINAALTPYVRCKIKKIVNGKIYVELVCAVASEVSGFTIDSERLKEYIGDTPWNIASLHALLLGDTSEELFDSECHKWIQQRAEGLEEEDWMQKLIDIHDCTKAALEYSDLLNPCGPQEREILEDRLTTFVEQSGYYISAKKKVKGGTADDYVKELLEKLKTSRFIYHPTKNFYTMMCVFMLDQEMMEKYMPEIIDILYSTNLEMWKRKPFKLAWVKILDLYVRSVYQVPDKMFGDKHSIENAIQALVKEIDLAEGNSEDLFDEALNRSMLYRLCSNMNVSNPDQLLEQSLRNLVEESDSMQFNVIKDEDPTYIANIIASQVKPTKDSTPAPCYFETKYGNLQIANNTISFLEKDSEEGHPMLPSNLGLWHNLNVRLNEKPDADLRTNNLKSISQYARLWNFIDNSLLSSQTSKTVAKTTRPDVGDEVQIIFTKKEDGLGQVFRCRVVSDGYEGEGTIDADGEIVEYHPGPLFLSDFQYNGRPLRFWAEVKKIQENGDYIFTMKPQVLSYMSDYVDHLYFNQRLVCFVNAESPVANRMFAVSSNGLQLSIGVDGDDFSVLANNKNKYIEAYDFKQTTQGFFNGTYACDTVGHHSLKDAFRQLLLDFTEKDIYEEEAESKELYSVMDQNHVMELMYVLETLGSKEQNLIKAYNYIAMCRLISLILGLDLAVQFYDDRMKLIVMLEEFNKSNEVDADKIKNFAGICRLDKSISLTNTFRTIQVLSWLNTSEHNEELFRLSREEGTDSVLQRLASLVLSYNYLVSQGIDSNTGDIIAKIRSLMNLAQTNSDKKYYGREDAHTEFKTSMVYPSDNHMAPDEEAQMKVILKEICAFCNADGGTLYIGVNDVGYERGISEDLKFYKDNKDHYTLHLNNEVSRQLGQEAAHCTKVSFDKEVGERVLIVQVEGSPKPISLDGDYYERMGTSARKVNDDYLPIFLENRKLWASEHGFTIKNVEEALEQKDKVKVKEAAKEQETVTVDSVTEKTGYDVLTSRVRNNVLHDFDNDYQGMVAVISFIGTDEFKVLDDDDWQESHLKLVIHEEEVNDWLILVYKDGSVVKTSIRELLGRQRGKQFKRFPEEIYYASVASDADSLALGLEEKDHRFMRFDDIASLEETNISKGGSKMVEVDYSGLHYCEIIPKKDVKLDQQPTKSLGYPLKPQAVEKMKKYLPGLEYKS